MASSHKTKKDQVSSPFLLSDSAFLTPSFTSLPAVIFVWLSHSVLSFNRNIISFTQSAVFHFHSSFTSLHWHSRFFASSSLMKLNSNQRKRGWKWRKVVLQRDGNRSAALKAQALTFHADQRLVYIHAVCFCWFSASAQEKSNPYSGWVVTSVCAGKPELLFSVLPAVW